LQRHCGQIGVYIAALPQPGAHARKRPSFGSIRIESDLAEELVEPSPAVRERVRTMIIIHGKS
jgi:hypothetical protein